MSAFRKHSDSVMSVDSNDTDSDQVHKLNFSTLVLDVPSAPNSSTKKRKRDNTNNNNKNNDNSPPNKKHKSSQPDSPCTIALPIIEKCIIQSNTHTAHKNATKKASNYQQPLRRSTRLKNNQKNNKNNNISNESKPKPKTKTNNKKNKNTKNINNHDWNVILSASIKQKYNARATPFKSSLKRRNKTFSRMKQPLKVNWGNVECRNYEQRCGILSCGVPSEHGPSLHLGKFISQTTANINEYGHNNNDINQLSKKERIKRVKQFCCSDVNTQKLKQDRKEIKLLQKSRNDIGCKCKSIYKMKKKELIDRIMYLDEKTEKKTLHKLKKINVFNMLIKLQFEKYGRYDVCCIDEECYCFGQGIECQIDEECCECGGNVVYNNNDEKNAYEKRMKKKDSLSCGNPNGNTVNVCVLDYVDGDNINDGDDILKTVESTYLEFESPFVQKRIKEWNEHYDNEEKNDDSMDRKDSKDNVQMVLRFD